MELLRDDGKVITEPGEKCLIHVTNLTRRLMPIIHYATDDAAEWVDASMKLFGRDVVGLKIGPTTYDFQHLRGIAIKTLGEGNISGFQVAARRKNTKDELVFRIVECWGWTRQHYIAVSDPKNARLCKSPSNRRSGGAFRLAIGYGAHEDRTGPTTRDDEHHQQHTRPGFAE